MDPQSVDIEGTIPSPAVFFQRIYNIEKTDNLPLTGNVQHISGQCEIYVLEYIRCLGNQ